MPRKPAAARKPRGPDKQPRLKPGHVRCVVCDAQLPESAAVVMNGQAAHPIACFDKLLKGRVENINRLFGGAP